MPLGEYRGTKRTLARHLSVCMHNRGGGQTCRVERGVARQSLGAPSGCRCQVEDTVDGWWYTTLAPESDREAATRHRRRSTHVQRQCLVWRSSNSIGHIDKVKPRRAWLAVPLVTTYCRCTFPKYFPGHSACHPSMCGCKSATTADETATRTTGILAESNKGAGWD